MRLGKNRPIDRYTTIGKRVEVIGRRNAPELPLRAETWNEYWAAILERRRVLLFGILAMAVQSISVIPVPLLLKYAVDDAIPNKSSGRLLTAAVGIVVLSLVTRVAAVASQHWTQTATKHATAKLRKKLSLRVFRANFANLGNLNSAVLHERMIGDAGRVEQVFTMILRSFLPNVLMVGGLLIMLFKMDPLLTLVSALLVPTLGLSTRLFRPWLQRSLKANQTAFETLSKRFLLAIRAQALLRARGMARAELGLLNDAVDVQQEASASRVNSVGISQAVQGTLLGISSAVTLTLGGIAVIDGRITLGAMLSFFAGFALLRGPIGVLASCSPQYIEGRLSCERIDSLIAEGMVDAEVTTRGTSGSLVLRSLSLDDVSFRYPGGAPLIDGVSMELRSGRTVALAGPNGSGKTTLLGLLLGLLTPDSGSACANGQPIATLDVGLDAIRAQVGVAFQHAEFLPGTVRSNVQFGRPNTTEADLVRALEEAEAEVVVAALEHGVDSWIGEDGDRLSGGERQRLAIARAIIGRPPLVILDEPNNHLPDTVIERILTRLSAWEHPPAVLLISHDPNVLRLADETVWLDRGNPSATNVSEMAL